MIIELQILVNSIKYFTILKKYLSYGKIEIISKKNISTYPKKIKNHRTPINSDTHVKKWTKPFCNNGSGQKGRYDFSL